MAYFDNAATTFPKPAEVYDFMDEFYRCCGANAGRGSYEASQSSSRLIAETRSLIKDILHCPAKETVFTPSATVALNIILQGLISTGLSTVYISPFEHNAVTRTLYAFEKKGTITIHQLFVSPELKYDLERIRYQFEENHPDLVIVSHASNVIGLVAPIEDIFSLAKKFNAFTVTDMSQSAGLVDCNVGLSTIDFAVFAGHKTLYGPTGISGFVMDPSVELPPVLFGGTGMESANQDMPQSLPERFEMGTLNISGIAGLNAALKWNQTVGIKTIVEKEKDNRERLLRILQQYDWISVVGNAKDNDYVGIVACLINGISSDSAASIFNSRNIAVRTGLQCAPYAHKFLNTYPAGTIRFSVGFFTSDDDFVELEEALGSINEELW